ncbi:Heterogeneous nuclear ribonucleoprotein K [Sarcoptes scabiei]|uniref:Heterogeneous nuclear ribonucleoprotein K n=1 Tax=Sarcoptes scabiei TaxID=52283 RepID=A0A834VH42_SARSC|nr:Heterogeneous nuclear ribonucleoprotein K [Sarcoptes scabiei]UXI15495.1 chromosome segregation in meiosis protein 3 [Sarcoptes scabiei]
MIMSDDGAEMFSNHSNLRIIQRVQDEFDDQIEDEYDEEIEASNRINRKRPLGFESIERPLKKSRTQNETFFDINDDSEEKLGNESEEDDDNGINDEEIEYNDDDNDAESNDEQFDNGLTESEIDLNTQKVQKNSKVYEESRREKFSQNSNHHSHSMRKLNDNNNNNFEAERKTKIIDNNNTTSDKNKMEIRFLVSSRDAGAIIGRGGSNITHLRQTYESYVIVPDCLSPERVLTVVTNVEHIPKIIKEILKFIDSTPLQNSQHGSKTSSNRRGNISRSNYPTSSSSNGNQCEIRLLLHTSHAGGLIGKGGSRITQLREETKAGIKIYSECCPQSTERVCSITGSIDIVTDATTVILSLIRTLPIKGPNQIYNPGNFDQFMSPRYGGFGETHPSPSSNYGPPQSHESNRSQMFSPPPIPPPPPSKYHHPAPPIHHPQHHSFSSPNRLPSHQFMDRSPPDYSSSSMSSWALGNGRLGPNVRGIPNPIDSSTPTAFSHSKAYYNSNDSPFHWMSEKPLNMHRMSNSFMKKDDISFTVNSDGTAISTIKVDHKLVGAIIGRGGNRIKNIRIKTQADISIDQLNCNRSGNVVRSIIIRGLCQDVQAAVEMICDCINDNQVY